MHSCGGSIPTVAGNQPVDGVSNEWSEFVQHLTTLKIISEMPEEQRIPSAQIPAIGPYLQGVLMERLDAAYVSYLHSLPFNPYSQYCYATKGGAELVWCIHTLTSEAERNIIQPLQGMEDFLVKGIDASFAVKRSMTEVIDLQHLTDLIRSDSTDRSSITFLTPTSFKRAGSYAFIPDARLILQNLLMRYNAVYEGNQEVDEDTIQYMEKNIHIVSYSLQSRYFSHVSHNYRIPAFTGRIVLKCRGPQPLVGLVRMLLKFGEYAGVGIKTSMGMGGIRCI